MLERLGKKRVALAIHDGSFPSDPIEDLGRGSPYDRGARRFLERIRDLGFNAIQLGPQGQPSLDNPSPYDTTVFSRSWLSIGLLPLVEQGLLERRTLDVIVAGRPQKQSYAYAYQTKRRALESISTGALRTQLADYRARECRWLEPDAIYDALEAIHVGRHWHDWPADLPPVPEEAIDRFASWQLIAELQHDELRSFCHRLGLELYGDLQVGLSPRDTWHRRDLFLRDYLMGAPPSRTNPEGQPWGYPVLDPERYLEGGLDFLVLRIERMSRFYDAIRIDHPHGLVCPWVYRDNVLHGARLFESPDHPEHPDLSRYAIARSDQIDPTLPLWADRRVRSLDPEQIDRYALLIDAIVLRTGALFCEVLSTEPFPLGCILDRHRLGRFRVTQKANLDDPNDVYRSENARPEDWIMVGTHDTKPIWLLAREWHQNGEAKRQADYLARRLLPRAEPIEQERFAVELATDRSALVHAKFADIFASEAENVMIFFADLFGLEEVYNRPGVVDDRNWLLRVPNGAKPALDLERVAELALCTRS